MNLCLRLSALIFLFLPAASFALVDMRNANYSDSWIDLQVKSSGFDLRLQRAYNSRTLYNGYFGFGWCTEFETNVVVTAENTLRIKECGAGFEAEYRPSTTKTKSHETNIKAIMAEVRKRNKGREERYFQNIERDIRIDNDLREEFARQLNIKGKVDENVRYLANGRANDYVTFANKEYTRYLPNGTLQKFNAAGQLIQLNDRNSNFIKITYRNDKIATVTDNSGASLQFKFDKGSKYVSQVSGPGGLTARYKYKGENLIEVTNAWKNTYKHEYDDLYNMTKLTYPDGKFIALTYNKDKDWVTSFRDVKGCLEKYEYTDNEKDPINNYKSSVVKTCGDKVTNQSSYEFWHKTRKDGGRYLSRTRSEVNGKVTDTIYHEEFGRPVEIVQDGVISRFDYFPNGLLKSKNDPIRTYSYKYDNACAKVSEVAVLTTLRAPANSKNAKAPKPEVRKQSTQFLYDPKRCNLISAKNSDGQLAQLSYDLRGRITRIYDQSKKEVLISYEERFGKPHKVSRPGLGTIEFKYKADGTMDKFDSEQDPMIALQVASIFSNLIEIIGPATSDVNSI